VGCPLDRRVRHRLGLQGSIRRHGLGFPRRELSLLPYEGRRSLLSLGLGLKRCFSCQRLQGRPTTEATGQLCEKLGDSLSCIPVALGGWDELVPDPKQTVRIDCDLERSDALRSWQFPNRPVQPNLVATAWCAFNELPVLAAHRFQRFRRLLWNERIDARIEEALVQLVGVSFGEWFGTNPIRDGHSGILLARSNNLLG